MAVSSRTTGSRSDARRNHALLVEAARSVFDEQGIDAPIEEITTRAGLGTGTLYRHFPTREALVDAIFEERFGALLEVVDHAVDCADPFCGLEQLLERLVALQRNDRVLKELMLRYPPREGLFDETRARMEQLIERLLSRARDQGALRADFTFADLSVLFWSLRPVLDATAEIAPEAWRRHLSFFLDGLRPAATEASPVPPLTTGQLDEAMRCLHAQRFQHWNRHLPREAP